jgi:hypothetical protein
MVTLDRAWCVLCALTARKPAHGHGHGHGHGQKAEKNDFWCKLRHKGGCCCFGWAVYAPWVCYMGIWALYNPKTPNCALTCQADLAADLQLPSFTTSKSCSWMVDVHVHTLIHIQGRMRLRCSLHTHTQPPVHGTLRPVRIFPFCFVCLLLLKNGSWLLIKNMRNNEGSTEKCPWFDFDIALGFCA